MIDVELTEIPSLEGSLSPIGSFSASIATIGGVSGTVSREINHDEYTGSYELIPRTYSQILNTADKIMRKNIDVNEIPYAEVSNPSGGTTVTIAFL